MIRHAAIAALVALSAMALVSCSSKSNKSASTVQSPTPAKQQPSHSSTAQAPGTDIAAMPHLYLLAATPAQDYGYPATLCRVVEDKLKAVRELVPQTEGVRFVQPWGNVIFLVDLPGEDVTVVHNDDPLQVDKVATHLGFVNPYELLLAMPNESAVDELLAIGQPDLGKVSLFSISSDPAASPRLRLNDWSEYAALRSDGAPGGLDESNPQFVFAEVSDDNLVIRNSFANQAIKIDSLAPAVRDAANATAMRRLVIVAADQRYLLLKNTYSFGELKSGRAGTSHQIFVHDRRADRWNTIQVPGTSNLSRSRLFAPWIATIVADFALNNATTGPGRENERGPEAFGDYKIAGSKGNPGNARFPLVRGQIGGPSGVLPGLLLLNNLEDGRNIRIETRQEDSEILSVRQDALLYRVNDTIYQATIVGDQLQNTSVLVKDEDVPEVHWVFWGP